MDIKYVKSKYISCYLLGYVMSAFGVLNIIYLVEMIYQNEFSILGLLNITLLLICLKKSIKLDEEKIVLFDFIKQSI